MSAVSTHTLANDLRVADVAPEDDRPTLAGVMAEYETVDAVYAAAEKVRDAGYTRWDVHSPFPIHGIEKAMSLRPTILPWICLAGGLAGLTGGLFLTVWTMGTSFNWAGGLQGYTYLISGKPYASIPQFIPVVFETTILLAAFSAGDRDDRAQRPADALQPAAQERAVPPSDRRSVLRRHRRQRPAVRDRQG